MEEKITHNKCECGEYLFVTRNYRGMFFRCKKCGYTNEVEWTCGGVN